MNIFVFFFIFLGSGLGGIARFLLSYYSSEYLIGKYGWSQFDYGTIIVNLTGSFVTGFLSEFVIYFLPPHLRFFLLIGFLGGFTTFSTYNYSLMRYFLEAEYSKFLIFLFIHTIGGILFTLLGYKLGIIAQKG